MQTAILFRRIGLILLICVIFIYDQLTAQSGSDEEPRKKTDEVELRTYWKDGLRLESNDTKYRIRIGGQLQNDWALMKSDDALKKSFGNFEDGTEFRWARLYISGQMFGSFEFKLQYDFAKGSSSFRDVYMGIQNIPIVGNFRAGQFKEPFGLEELMSDNHLTFMERSLPGIYAPSRNTGILIYNSLFSEKMTWSVGMFREANDFGKSLRDGQYNATARITTLPLDESNGKSILHLGVSFSYRNPLTDTITISASPEANLAPKLAVLSKIPVARRKLIGAEGAFVFGQASLQAEYILQSLQRPTGASVALNGFYISGSYFLTDEHRKYKKTEGIFEGVKPRSNLMSDSGGYGAFEIVIRYSTLDLNHHDLVGGILEDITLGINWYLNPNIRIMTNYIHAKLKDIGKADIAQVRFQLNI